VPSACAVGIEIVSDRGVLRNTNVLIQDGAAQLAAFMKLVSATPAPQKPTEATTDLPKEDSQSQRPMNNGPLALDKIIKVEGRIVSLSAAQLA
jgi:hypothetical protein